ncbi:putative polygalacturonase, partial [Trifolium medium]|nr:putative polygalacturonase [Trifolium medium]
RSRGRGESAVELTVVFLLCDWDCSSGEWPRNSTIGGNLKVFLVLIHYLYCAVNYGSQMGKLCDPYALPEFNDFNYRDLVAEEKTMGARVEGVSDYYFTVIGTSHATINREVKAKWQPRILAFQNYHVSKELFPSFGVLCKFGDIQVEDKRMRKCNIVVVTPLHEYFLLANMLIPFSLEESNYICETVYVAWLFGGGLSSFKQWNLRDKDLILNYYCTKRVLMQIVARAVLLVIKCLEMEKGYATSNALMFATTILNSSTMVIPWDPGKCNAFMAKVACEYCWRRSPSIYGLLNLVYDRGKFWTTSNWVQLISNL